MSHSMHATSLSSQAYSRSVVLWTLTAVYTLSFLDRQIVAILANDIKRDLALSDAQVGLITGTAFAVLYATLGVPIARLADRRSRPRIISACLTIWSVMTAACGLAASFVQLALARVGVGVGEAGCMPPSHSLIAELFPPEKRSGAMAIFQLGVPLGVLFGFLAGGWINEALGWRSTLIAVGLPGVLVALWVLYAVPELRMTVERVTPPPFWKLVRQLWCDPCYRHLAYGATLASAGGYAAIGWTPSMVIRDFDLGTGYVGAALSLTVGICGALGSYFGGKTGDAAGRRSPAGACLVAGWICAIAAPAFLAAYMGSTATFTLICLAAPFALAFAWMGPTWAMVQGRAPPDGRAVASSAVLLMINLLGLGLAPLVVGAISDFLAHREVARSLRAAVTLCVVCAYAWAALHFFLAARWTRRGGE